MKFYEGVSEMSGGGGGVRDRTFWGSSSDKFQVDEMTWMFNKTQQRFLYIVRYVRLQEKHWEVLKKKKKEFPVKEMHV